MTTRPLFRDRNDAGGALARALGSASTLRGQRDVLVLGMPRGGVPVARHVAAALRAPLDVIVARKVGVPGLREVALGAIAEGSRRVVEDSVGWYLGVPPRVVARIAQREWSELERRVRVYRAGKPLPDVQDRTVILVDDGLATGATLRAAALAVRSRRPARLIAAVPVAAAASCDEVRACVDELITVATPDPFETVSAWYEDFTPVADSSVLRALGRHSASHVGEPDPADEQTVAIRTGPDPRCLRIAGDLGGPDHSHPEPRGLVILAHGGGSSRQSYRNRYLAGRLRLAGWATLRLDLLLEHEAADDAESARLRFDVPFITRRLVAAVDWAVRKQVDGAGRVILFGASTGAAAALLAAADRPAVVAGVVSRGGRVDLAAGAFSRLGAPVLMVVGGADHDTLRQNRTALGALGARARLRVIPGGGHTFEEPGALGAVGEHVVRWLDRLPGAARPNQWLNALRRRASVALRPVAGML